MGKLLSPEEVEDTILLKVDVDKLKESHESYRELFINVRTERDLLRAKLDDLRDELGAAIEQKISWEKQAMEAEDNLDKMQSVLDGYSKEDGSGLVQKLQNRLDIALEAMKGARVNIGFGGTENMKAALAKLNEAIATIQVWLPEVEK